MLYAHVSVLYSLHIASIVSMAKGELSQADSIFVLVTVASPASIYLWYLTIRSFWNITHFPIEHANKNKPMHKSMEVQVVRAISIGSLLFEIVLLCLMFIPSKAIKFSQPACNKQYGSVSLWYNVAWQLPVLIQTFVMLIFWSIALGLCKLWTRRKAYEMPPPYVVTSLLPCLY